MYVCKLILKIPSPIENFKNDFATYKRLFVNSILIKNTLNSLRGAKLFFTHIDVKSNIK